MAKVTTPLLSFSARGQVAKTLVYFPWKGIDAVRSYVRPANPNTGSQQTQRGKLTNAVSRWHNIGLTADDITAWNRQAATRPTPMSGFNSFCKDDIEYQGRVVDIGMGFDGALADDADGTFTGVITEGGDATAVTMKWGTSPTSLIHSEACAEAANTWTGAPADDVSGQTIYARFFLFDTGDPIGSTGIYTVLVA